MSGTITIAPATSLTLTSADLSANVIAFGGFGATLVVDRLPSGAAATFVGFGADNTLEISGQNANTVVLNGTLLAVDNVVTSGNRKITTQIGSINLIGGDYTSVHFNVGQPMGTNVGTLIVIPCFVAGTRIATEGGDREVQTLRPGDRVRLARGGLGTVAWVGLRDVACDGQPYPAALWPVRIVAGAFAPGVPRRDLWLSPDHAVLVHDVLVPVRRLCNGATIRQVPRDRVTYVHVELGRHDVVLAEGLAAESFLDTGNRGNFDRNFGATRRGKPVHPCALLASRGPAVSAARRDLARRAIAMGYPVGDDPGLVAMAGERMLPVRREGVRCRVALPPGGGAVRLRSRHWVPAELVPETADARQLGVAVARLSLDGRAVALDDARLSSGWHAPERDWRWTDGDAGLALAGVSELAFDLAMTGRYLGAS